MQRAWVPPQHAAVLLQDASGGPRVFFGFILSFPGFFSSFLFDCFVFTRYKKKLEKNKSRSLSTASEQACSHHSHSSSTAGGAPQRSALRLTCHHARSHSQGPLTQHSNTQSPRQHSPRLTVSGNYLFEHKEPRAGDFHAAFPTAQTSAVRQPAVAAYKKRAHPRAPPQLRQPTRDSAQMSLPRPSPLTAMPQLLAARRARCRGVHAPR